MADLGQTDLSFKPDVNIAAIASLAQKKAEIEQQQAYQGQQMQTMQQDRTMQTIKMASDLTQSLIKTSAEQQMRQGQQHVSDLLARQNNPVSSEVPQATFGQTSGFQPALQSALVKANPNVIDTIAAQQFPRPASTTDQLLAQAIKSNNPSLINKITTAKQQEKPAQVGRIFQQIGPDGKTHNTRIEGDGAITDLGLAAANTKTTAVNRLLADGTTHKIVRDSNGNEEDLGLVGSSSSNQPSATAKSTADFARSLEPHLDQMDQLIDEANSKGLLGPVKGRLMLRMMAGKIGTTGDPTLDKLAGELNTMDSLNKSGLLKVHFGSRGGQQMYEKFSNILDVGKQSPELMHGSIKGMREFVQGYEKAGNTADYIKNLQNLQAPNSQPQGIDAIANVLGLKKRK